MSHFSVLNVLALFHRINYFLFSAYFTYFYANLSGIYEVHGAQRHQKVSFNMYLHIIISNFNSSRY